MKNPFSFSILCALQPAALLAALAGLELISAAADPALSKESKTACCPRVSTATNSPLPDLSIYQLESKWTADTGAAFQLASLRGRPVIITLFFAQCAYACPILVNDMLELAAALPPVARTNTGFVLVSFDSERDTSAALAEYRRAHAIPGDWTLLRGEPEDVLELAMLLGVKFKRDARGQFAHSNLITLLTPEGEIALQQAGLNTDPAPTITALQKLLPTPAPND